MTQSRLITDGDREYILTHLKQAPDSVLVQAFNSWASIRQEALTCRGIINDQTARSNFSDSVSVESTDAVVGVDSNPTIPSDSGRAARVNVDPGRGSISRIGSSTKDELLGMVAKGQQPPKKYSEHMKLLWERNEVKFDGKEYWL